MLIALVSSYGAKTQKTAQEIAEESLQDISSTTKLLRLLIDLRLVRELDGQYEIVHDYLAKTIMAELVSTEEREARKFKDLLASRAAAYEDTHAILTLSEHLHIYAHRAKILCDDEEVRLLLASHLAGNGPVHYWLRRYPPNAVRAWVRPLTSDQDTETRLNAFRLLIALGERVPLARVADAFSDYNLRAELAAYVTKLSRRSDVPLLLRLIRSKVEEVKKASHEVLLKMLSLADAPVLEKLVLSCIID